MFKLTEKQQEIIDCSSQVKLVIGGHRSGKTILAIINMWEQMKKENNHNFKGLYLVRSTSVLKMIERQVKNLVPIESLISIIRKEDYTIIKTVYGEIFVSIKFIDLEFENKTIDEATSNKYVISKEFWKDVIGFTTQDYSHIPNNPNICITGHLPSDINNDFFKLWLSGVFSKDKRIQSFRLEDNFCDISNDNQLIKAIGKNRFNREYLAIPDYFEFKTSTNEEKASYNKLQEKEFINVPPYGFKF